MKTIHNIVALCLFVSPVLHAVGPMPERKMTKDEVKQTAQEIIWELTTKSTPLTIADTIAVNDAALTQAAQTARQQAAERSKREEQERAQHAAEYQASLVKVADIADASIEAELIPAPAKRINTQPVTQFATAVSHDLDFDKEAENTADFVYGEQAEQMHKEQEQLVNKKDNKQTAQQQAAIVTVADIADADIATEFVPAQVAAPAQKVVTESIPATTQHNTATQEQAAQEATVPAVAPQVQVSNDEEEQVLITAAQPASVVYVADIPDSPIAVNFVPGQAIMPALPVATDFIPARPEHPEQATVSQTANLAIAHEGVSATPENLGTWCEYIREFQAAYDREHRATMTANAVGVGLGLLIAYLAYKGCEWVYDHYTPGPSKIKGFKQAKNPGRPAGKMYRKALKKA